jgi:hypothetical protein
VAVCHIGACALPKWKVSIWYTPIQISSTANATRVCGMFFNVPADNVRADREVIADYAAFAAPR